MCSVEYKITFPWISRNEQMFNQNIVKIEKQNILETENLLDV